MDLDEKEFQMIDDLKEKEKQNAQKSVVAAMASLSLQSIEKYHDPQDVKIEDVSGKTQAAKQTTPCADVEDTCVVNTSKSKTASKVESDEGEQAATLTTMVPNKSSQDEKDSTTTKQHTTKTSSTLQTTKKSVSTPVTVPPPPPRTRRRTTIEYTPRIFKTPQRDSAKQREQAFIAKNRPFLRTNAHLNQDAVDATESNPIWLKKKGDDFARHKNFPSAIQAYTAVLECFGGNGNGVNDTTHKHDNCVQSDESSMVLAQVIANRALCHLQLHQEEDCIRDCNTCIEQMDALFSNNDADGRTISLASIAALTHKILTRKCTALCHAGRLDEAYDTMQSLRSKMAIDVDDAKQTGTDDLVWIDTLRRAMEQKQQGDTHMMNAAAGGAATETALALALSHYQNAIELYPLLAGAHGNKTLCRFVLGDYKACIADCTECLNVMRTVAESSVQALTIRFRFNANAAQQKEWEAVILARRGAAKQLLGDDAAGAAEDYQAALTILEASKSKQMGQECSFIQDLKTELSKLDDELKGKGPLLENVATVM
jgi:hypothetical protein